MVTVEVSFSDFLFRAALLAALQQVQISWKQLKVKVCRAPPTKDVINPGGD